MSPGHRRMAAGLALFGMLWGLGCRQRQPQDAGPSTEEIPGPVEQRQPEPLVDLYFPAAGGRLGMEQRALALPEEPEARARAVVEALLSGPREDRARLVRPFSEDVELGEIYLTADGVAFVDLRTPEPQEPPSTGSREEMQVVYSLVNSITLNVPEAHRVVLLWNGRQRLTFSGHLDTSRPLGPNTALVIR